MCMVLPTLLNRVRRISLHQKKVYKVMVVRDDFPKDTVQSPHQAHFYILGETQYADMRVEFSHWEQHHILNEGIHAFTDIADAQREQEAVQSKLESQYYFSNALSQSRRANVYECIIPAWTTYYVGVWGTYYPKKRVKNVVASAMYINKLIDKPASE